MENPKPQDIKCPERDSNPAPSEYNSEAIGPEPAPSVQLISLMQAT
jgi:hypothetical protein